MSKIQALSHQLCKVTEVKLKHCQGQQSPILYVFILRAPVFSPEIDDIPGVQVTRHIQNRIVPYLSVQCDSY